MIIAPALVSGWLLAFTLLLDDLVIASFTTGPGATTLPMRIYSQVRLGVTPEINAISTVLIGFVTLAVIAAPSSRNVSRLGDSSPELAAVRRELPALRWSTAIVGAPKPEPRSRQRP
jgi:putrescine transport system permease protein